VHNENKPGTDEPEVNDTEGNDSGRSKEEKHKKVIIPMLIYASLMFGLGFAMAPLYELFCEVTGIKDTTARKAIVEYTIDRSRSIRVEFDATINQELEFEFRPMTKFVEVNPGELKVVDFYVKNNSDRDVVAQAIPSVTPVLATTHLNKIECFCFDQQKLKAGEEKIMPLHFVLGTELPEDIVTVTLSYTFMDTNRDKMQKNLNDAEKKLKELI